MSGIVLLVSFVLVLYILQQYFMLRVFVEWKLKWGKSPNTDSLKHMGKT